MHTDSIGHACFWGNMGICRGIRNYYNPNYCKLDARTNVRPKARVMVRYMVRVRISVRVMVRVKVSINVVICCRCGRCCQCSGLSHTTRSSTSETWTKITCISLEAISLMNATVVFYLTAEDNEC